MRISDWSSDVCSSDLFRDPSSWASYAATARAMTRFETTSQRSDPMSLNDVVGQLLRGGMSPASRTRLEHSPGPNGLGGLDAKGGLGAEIGRASCRERVCQSV